MTTSLCEAQEAHGTLYLGNLIVLTQDRGDCPDNNYVVYVSSGSSQHEGCYTVSDDLVIIVVDKGATILPTSKFNPVIEARLKKTKRHQ